MKEKEGSRNRTLLSVIAVIALIAIVAGATFAFFASTQDINANLPANITTAGKTYTFIASADGEINFYLSAQDMSEDNVNENYIMTDNGLINVEVASANDGEITRCTYDIAWVWDSDNKYTTPDVELPYEKDGKTYPYELSVSVDGGIEQDLSTFTLDSNNSFIIATGLTSIATSATPIIDSHKIEVKAYNIPIDQQNLFNKSFQAHLKVVNNNCITGELELVDYITNEIYNEDGVDGLYYHDRVGTYTNANLEAGDNSYRYAGIDPNNYLCFKKECTDDEKYRIIGVIDNKVKIIKMTNDGDRAWNSKTTVEGYGINTWIGSTMETYLNGEYLIKLGTTADLIDTTTWHVGGFTYEQYTLEDAMGIFTLENTSTPIIDKKVGLMYVSDYMYAAEPTYWNLIGWNSDATKDYRASKGHDWLLTNQTHEWTISRYSNSSDSIFQLGSVGIVGNYSGPAAYGGTRPTFSLKSSVKLKSGIGTSSDPYIVGL